MPNVIETALREWLDKTEWVQQQISTFGIGALGKHRADVMREEIERLRAALAQQEQPVAAQQDETAVAMREVAEEHAHGLALELECILLDYSGKWYDSAMNRLSAYRDAMNAIHERESPTHMGEPVVTAALPAQAPQQEAGQARELPPLPHTTYNGYSDGSEPLYTAEQMQEYARAAQSAPAQPTVPAVMLKRDTNGVCEVSLEIEGRWVRVIRDAGDIISHIVEPVGIQRAIAAAPVAQEKK